MQDKELYQHILGLVSPWSVSEVKLDLQQQQIDVYVTHPGGTKFPCPHCLPTAGEAGSNAPSLACYDHAPPRAWRHLDSCQFKTMLHASVPRIECPTHGVVQATVPWALPNSRFTLLFERFAIDVLLATQTVKGATQILRTSWDETWHILERAVERGQLRKQTLPMPRIGIDEKAFAKGQNYITLLYDLTHSTVEAIADGNDTASGIACFSRLSSQQLATVEAVAMDMSAAFVSAAQQTIPLAEEKIVHDRFHVMQMATKAVDQVRRGEHRQLQFEDDHRLAKTKYIWLTSQENLSDSQKQKLEETFHLQLKTGKAWSYKELLRDLWHHPDAASATQFFKEWYRRVIHTKLKPMKRVAQAIKQRLANVVSFCTHGITNAVAEGINSKIMAIKRRVGGFRNRENFKTAIFFHCGGLQLHP